MSSSDQSLCYSASTRDNNNNVKQFIPSSSTSTTTNNTNLQTKNPASSSSLADYEEQEQHQQKQQQSQLVFGASMEVPRQPAFPEPQVTMKKEEDGGLKIPVQKKSYVNIEPKADSTKVIKPLAPLAPKKQILPKILPAQPKNNLKNGGVNTSKQWVLPPRPRPGRKSTDNTPVPQSAMASPMMESLSSSPPPQSPSSVSISKKQTKIRKTIKPKKTTNTKDLIDNKGNFELKLQLQTATEENENLRKIISKLNREIDLLKLNKLENNKGSKLPSVPEDATRIDDLTSTIDPVKINYNLKSKRLKRFNSESGYNSGVGLNGNSLDDAGFYNADSLMPSDLLLGTSRKPQSSVSTLVADEIKPRHFKSVKLGKSQSVPLNTFLKKNFEPCGFCSNGSPCVCYESTSSTLELLPNRDIDRTNKIVKADSVPPLPIVKPATIQQSRLSRTTDIIGNLGKNFIKNEMDVDMSFFMKPDEQDFDDFMMM